MADYYSDIESNKDHQNRSGRVDWCAGFRILCLRGRGFESSVPNYLVWDGGQWRDSVSSARFDPALNGYLEKSGEGK